jgi:hypothetical protein
MQKVKDLEKVAGYLGKKSENRLSISCIIIGNCNRLDIIDAERKARNPITILSPNDFYQKYKKDLEGEPKWLFDSKID